MQKPVVKIDVGAGESERRCETAALMSPSSVSQRAAPTWGMYSKSSPRASLPAVRPK